MQFSPFFVKSTLNILSIFLENYFVHMFLDFRCDRLQKFNANTFVLKKVGNK